MSAVIKSRIAFLEKSLLMKSLTLLEVEHWESSTNEIVTHRKDYYGNQKFRLEKGRYVFLHDSSSNRANYHYRKENWGIWGTTNLFLNDLEKRYNQLFEERQLELERLKKEEELRRIEEERKKYVESRKQEIIEKAKAQGYQVQEKMAGNKIKLVLIKHTY